MGEAVDVVKIAIGFVLVLLVQLVVVETFIIEFCDQWSGWFGPWFE